MATLTADAMRAGSIPRAWQEALDALAAAPRAWMSGPELMESLAWSLAEALATVSQLEADGLVTLWYQGQPQRPVVSLTPFAASVLCVRLAEFGFAGLRWIPVGEPGPPDPKSKNVCSDARAASLEYMADLTPPATEQDQDFYEQYALDVRFPHERRGYRYDQAAPYPTSLLGSSLTPWPGPKWRHDDRPCPACLGRHLHPNEFCLLCERWGLDGVFCTVKRPRLHLKSVARQAAKDAGRAAAARDTRKAKRKARFEGWKKRPDI